MCPQPTYDHDDDDNDIDDNDDDGDNDADDVDSLLTLKREGGVDLLAGRQTQARDYS